MRGAKLCLGLETKIMGVLNVTPDSFSDGGCFLDPNLAEARAVRMEEEGAHFIDVGGESSKPGSEPVSAKEEIRRLKPVLKRISKSVKIPISVDTYKTEVAKMALDEGVSLVNDIYALNDNKHLARLIARYKAGVVLMHMQGDPKTMQQSPCYQDLLEDISAYLERAIHFAEEAGISKKNIAIDPGFGFGKTTDQNLEILSRLDFFKKLECPILVGLSRKSFIGHVLGTPVLDRLYGSLGAAGAAIGKGAHILRVHDVLPHRHLATLLDSISLRTSRKGAL
ncbi:MAG: dihydropteroate synthase [Candidatus Omnitrophica bacterium CG1_02_46_14]|nr:MAG: dihydropteroate synthase [Candidatus Omnitrophica bacterium CG1_02_46_14]